MSARSDAMRALDSQLSLISMFKSELGEKVAVYFMESMITKNSGTFNPEVMEENGEDVKALAKNNGIRMASEIAHSLNEAQTYMMSEQMMDLNIHAGASVPETPFYYENLPSPAGFLLLPKPLVIIDVHGFQMSHRAMAWWPTTVIKKSVLHPEGVPYYTLMVALFSNKNDWKVDHYLEKFHNENFDKWVKAPEWMLAHWQDLEFGKSWLPEADDMDDILRQLDDEGDERFTKTLDDNRDFLKTKLGVPDDASDEVLATLLKKLVSGVRDDPRKMFEWLAFLQSFFLLVNQEVAVLSPQTMDRATSRRLKRMDKPPDFGDVQVVVLRRERPTSDKEVADGTPLNYTHRWIVSGHWRNQWYPKRQRNEPIWINAYEKGPEHLPLVVKDKVFVWKR